MLLPNPCSNRGKSVSAGVGFSAPTVDARTAAGQKLNPPSLFFSSFPFISHFCFGKFEIEIRQPGKPKGDQTDQDPDGVDG